MLWENVRALNVHNVSKAPAPPKKPVPEEIVPAPIPKKAPPRGRIDISLLEISFLVRAWVLAPSVKSVSVLPLLVSFLRDSRGRALGVCNFFVHFANERDVRKASPNSREKGNLCNSWFLSFNTVLS